MSKGTKIAQVERSTGELTVVDEPVVENHTQGEIYQVEKELSVVVDTDAVINPRAMAERHCQSRLIDPQGRRARGEKRLTDRAWRRIAGTFGSACSSKVCGSYKSRRSWIHRISTCQSTRR